MLTVVVVALLGAVILGALGWLISVADSGLGPEPPDQPDLGPVDRQISAADVDALRFRLAFRGYRMEDVDAAMRRLADALAAAEAELAHRPAGLPGDGLDTE